MKVIIAALTAAFLVAGTTLPAGAGPSGETTQGYRAYEVKTQYVQKRALQEAPHPSPAAILGGQAALRLAGLVAANGPRGPRRPPPLA